MFYNSVTFYVGKKKTNHHFYIFSLLVKSVNNNTDLAFYDT